MATFENLIVKCFNAYYDKAGIAAMAYRLPQIRYRTQGFDVYSDSRHLEWYCAIECKSIEAESERPLYFSQYFHVSKGVHQLDHENSIVEGSGRTSFLAVELRRRRGLRKSAFLVPWRTVMSLYKQPCSGISPEIITNCCELDYHSGGYHITDDVLEQYMYQVCGKPKSKKVDKVELRDWHSRETKRG